MCMWVVAPSWSRKDASTALRRSRCSCGMASTLQASGRLHMLNGQHRLGPRQRPGRTAMPTDSVSNAALITGCSSGIGRATAEHLAARGWTVYASARRPDSIADLEQAGCRLVGLDVTDED